MFTLISKLHHTSLFFLSITMFTLISKLHHIAFPSFKMLTSRSKLHHKSLFFPLSKYLPSRSKLHTSRLTLSSSLLQRPRKDAKNIKRSDPTAGPRSNISSSRRHTGGFRCASRCVSGVSSLVSPPSPAKRSM